MEYILCGVIFGVCNGLMFFFGMMIMLWSITRRIARRYEKTYGEASLLLQDMTSKRL